MIVLFDFELSHSAIAILMVVGLLIGMAKTGVHGTGMIAVPLLAATFGGKFSSGLMLPMLIFADFFGVRYYHRHAQWPHLWRLFPWAAVGIILGTFIGNYIDDQLFRTIMGVIIFMSLMLMVWLEKGNRDQVPDYWWFAMILGIAAGFTTMVGNLAGSSMALYLLSMRMPKNRFIGTAAWFFLVINLFKVPFHVFSWETITLNSFLLNLITLPAIAIGAFLGLKIIRKVPERAYRWFIILMTAVAALVMVF